MADPAEIATSIEVVQPRTAVHRSSLVTELPEGMKLDVAFTMLEQV